MRRYKTVEAALARGVMHANSPLDAAKIWVWSMRGCRYDDPALAEDGTLLLAGLRHFDEQLAATPEAVDLAIDRAAVAFHSLNVDAAAIAEWDASEDWQIGKVGYRFDTAAVVIGVGRAAAEQPSLDDVVDAALREFGVHLIRQGAIDASECAAELARYRRIVENALGVLSRPLPPAAAQD